MALWEVENAIEAELFQNIELASIGVFILIYIFLSNFKLSLLVQLCVILTLVRFMI